MYISHAHKTVFIALPKNASRTVGVLMKNEYNAIDEDHHSIVPSHPKAIGDYFPFAIIRNPYSRCVSRWYGWYQTLSLNPHNLNFRKALLPSFENYIDKLDDWHTSPKRIEPENALYHSCQIHIIDKVKELFTQKVRRVRFENLQKDLEALPFIQGHVKLPKRGIRSNVYGDWRAYYERPRIARKVYDAYLADFKRLDYSADIP